MTVVERVQGGDIRTGNSLHYSVGAAFLGDQWVRMWGARSGDIATRLKTGLLSKDLLCFLNDVDDFIDIPDIEKDERVQRLKSGKRHLLDGVCECAEVCQPVYQKALQMHDQVIDNGTSIRDTFADLIEAGIVQLTDASIQSQHTAAKIIGASCMKLSVDAGEKVIGQKAPTAIRNAAGEIGIYGYFLDLAYEVDEDASANALTYATALVEQGLSSNTVRKEVVIEANAHLARGQSFTSRENERRYANMGRLIHLKYKLESIRHKA